MFQQRAAVHQWTRNIQSTKMSSSSTALLTSDQLLQCIMVTVPCPWWGPWACPPPPPRCSPPCSTWSRLQWWGQYLQWDQDHISIQTCSQLTISSLSILVNIIHIRVATTHPSHIQQPRLISFLLSTLLLQVDTSWLLPALLHTLARWWLRWPQLQDKLASYVVPTITPPTTRQAESSVPSLLSVTSKYFTTNFAFLAVRKHFTLHKYCRKNSRH